jgi:DNA-binding NarL/FixJ family response regulator
MKQLTNIKISIADDHPMMIQGLEHVLLRYPHIILTGTFLNGVELLAGLEKEVPDVLLLDIQLPGKTGDELAPLILKKYPDLKILTLTNFDSTLYANNMMKHGVHGYLLKTADEQVLKAIETVSQGGIFIEESMRIKMQQIDYKIRKAVSSKSSLTPREKEILQLLVNGDTCPEIAEKLYLSTGTVENYRVSILLKLDAKNTAALVSKALKLGLAN